jgi:hypothetical protein
MNAVDSATSLVAPRSASGVPVLLVLAALNGCSNTPQAAAPPEGATPASGPVAPSSPSGGAGAETAPPASAEPAAPGSAGPAEPSAQPPKKRGAPVDIAVVGKHAGDASIERVVLGVKTGLQNCYEAGLENAPTASGIVEFKIHITASGSLKKVESANPNTMPGGVTNCMVGRFGALSFEPRPATTIEVKVTCRTAE